MLSSGHIALTRSCHVMWQVLDNCPIHHTYVDELREMVESRGALLRFLAPYCCIDSPIEPSFNSFKSYLKRHGAWADANDEHDVLKYALRHCVTAEQAMNYYTGCGYSNRPDYQAFLEANGFA